MKRAVLVLVVLVLVAGCGGESSDKTTSSSAQTTTVRVYFLRDGKVWPVPREIETVQNRPQQAVTTASVSAALFELRQGPTESEIEDLGVSTALPDSFADAVVVGPLSRYDAGEDLSDEALAQVVYTLTQFPTVEAVEVGGKKLTRVDFEEQTPSVLVESPLPFEEVASPVRVTGTANTFEATFHYELTDTDGRIVDENFVTATSGTGTRGTFDFTTEPFTVPFDGVGALIVFERSAEDGSRMNVVEIPLRMTR